MGSTPHLPAHHFYGAPSHFNASYRSRAIRDAIILNLGYIPIYFLAACAYMNPHIIRRYKTTIMFAGVVQFVLSLPFTMFNMWMAIFLDHDVETTVLMCTLVRFGTAALNFISFNALTAISMSRLLLIIFNLNCGLLGNCIFFVLACCPIVADIAYMFFVSRLIQNAVCGPILFFSEMLPLMASIWNVYIFAIPLIAVLLNSVTAGYLMYKRCYADANIRNSQRRVNELFIATALLMQSVIPALTMSSKGYRSMQWIYGIKSVAWLDNLIELSGSMTTGLNMIASMICIRHFREMFTQLIRRDRSISRVPEVTTLPVTI